MKSQKTCLILQFCFLAIAILFMLKNVAGSAILEKTLSNDKIDAKIKYEYWVYKKGIEPFHRLRPWNMKWSEMPIEGTDNKYLWFNYDWKAQPWAGVTFERTEGQPLELSDEWLQKGFIRFLITGGYDRYGSPNANLYLQIKPIVERIDYQHLPSRFIDRGRGLDEDPATWQEVLVPLKFWTGLKPGMKVNGVSIQCVDKPSRSFGLDEIGLVLYNRIPEWLEILDNADVSQPWVKWPTYNELPDILKSDLHPPRVQDGKFVGQDGRRIFILNPYSREDPRSEYWGGLDGNNIPPDHGLYDPEAHGWIYEQIPNAERLCRLGFNSISVTMPPQPWWNAVDYKQQDRGSDPGRLAEYAKEVNLPFYVDTVCWPWTLGQPAAHPEQTNLPKTAFTEGQNHWTPYRTIGEGRAVWLNMWKIYAERYRDAGVNVLAFELMNEPAYVGVSEDHKEEFITWLKERYGDLASLNMKWKTDYKNWREVIQLNWSTDMKKIPGPFFDYDEYLADGFTKLIADGVELVSSILPGSLVGIQTMGGYALSPREAVWKHRLVEHETVILAPTGGGRWTSGSSASKPMPSVLENPMAGAPLENDLLLAISENKMVFDNETYLRGQTAIEVRNRLWEHVLAGLDGLTVFSWSKRGWMWWQTRDALVTEADKFPYSDLIPIARRTEALRGIYDFAAEVQPIADQILPKPWGPKPKIGILYSWANARRQTDQRELSEKTSAYYTALKYTHANIGIIPSHKLMKPDGLDGVDIIVAGGIQYVEDYLPDVLESFVRSGGVLIIGEATMNQDIYGNPINTSELCGVEVGEVLDGSNELVLVPEGLSDERLSGEIRLVSSLLTLKPGKNTSVLLYDKQGRPVVTKQLLGKGIVYTQGADLIGYPLAKLLWAIIEDAGKTVKSSSLLRLAQVIDADTNKLAPNILLSRRSYNSHHVFLLMNRDSYEKNLCLKLDLPPGRWSVIDGLSNKVLHNPDGNSTWQAKELADQGIGISISIGGPVVLIIKPQSFDDKTD